MRENRPARIKDARLIFGRFSDILGLELFTLTRVTAMQDMRTDQAVALTRRYAARNYQPFFVSEERGEGVWVWDAEERRYLDCLATYSAVNLGHRHPRITAAAHRQLEMITSVPRSAYNCESALYYRDLAELFGPNMMVHPMNTGAEAVEKAVFKIARKWGYTVKGIPDDQAEIVFLRNNFHGRTVGVISGSTEAAYRKNFGPFVPGIKFANYGDIEDLRSVIGPNTAAVIVEPIQGEGGILIPPDGYLAAVRNLCTKENILMIADEIQTGFGRTGYFFACDYEKVAPDMYILGKALGGGILPVSAVVGPSEIIGVLEPGDDGSTFGGNPLGAAVARETIKVFCEERPWENARVMGEYFMERLCGLNSPHIKEVRGRGLMIGVELKASSGPARRFCERLIANGILTNVTHEHVIRFTPPIIISQDEIDWGMTRIAEALEAD
jgi:ornithine--oxo-acid transaminase